MGFDGKLKPAKMRHLARVAGIETSVIMAFANHPWVTLVTVDDQHVYVHQHTHEIEHGPADVHWTTCPSSLRAHPELLDEHAVDPWRGGCITAAEWLKNEQTHGRA